MPCNYFGAILRLNRITGNNSILQSIIHSCEKIRFLKLTGLATEADLVYLGVASDPAGWIALGAVAGVDLLWTFDITPMIYDVSGKNEQHHLQPLSGDGS